MATSHLLRVRISSERRKRKLKKRLNANPSKKVAVQTDTPSVPSQSQGTMSPINAHHTGKAIKGEEIAISQANTSHLKASTDINLAENALKLMESMVSHLKSLRRPVKKTGLQLYQEVVVPSTKDLKALYQWDNHFSLIFITSPEQTNKELINLFYNDVKNFTSSLNFSRAPNCIFSNNATKALSLRDNHSCLFLNISALQSCGDNLLYNDVKNLTSILSFCIGPKFVFSNGDTKALFLCELHFSLIFTSRPLNHQRTNKQLITLTYNEMKSLSSILSCCNGVNSVPSKERLESIMSMR